MVHEGIGTVAMCVCKDKMRSRSFNLLSATKDTDVVAFVATRCEYDARIVHYVFHCTTY